VNGTRDRDESVERWLRQSLQTPRNASVTESCLDAETVAAWVDGGLSGAALEMAQSHVADCARCQALVGTVARLNSVVPLAEPAHASRRWLAWVVPLTAAAAAIALWVAVPRDNLGKFDSGDRAPKATEAQRQTDETKVQEPALLDGPLQAPSRAKTEQESRPTNSSDAAKDAANSDAASGNQIGAQPELRRDATRFEADRLEKQPGPESAVAPSASAAPAPAASPADAAPPALAEKSAIAARSAARAQTADIEIVSPDPSVRWRIAGPVVERSTNGGARWEAAPTGVASPLTAGAAPSVSVCWLVGRGGVVLLSTDGRNWRRLAFPETTDLSAVQATDARAASVSTADGRTFSTTDGGVTWVRRPVQEF
jgi:hypothetical protein